MIIVRLSIKRAVSRIDVCSAPNSLRSLLPPPNYPGLTQKTGCFGPATFPTLRTRSSLKVTPPQFIKSADEDCTLEFSRPTRPSLFLPLTSSSPPLLEVLYRCRFIALVGLFQSGQVAAVARSFNQLYLEKTAQRVWRHLPLKLPDLRLLRPTQHHQARLPHDNRRLQYQPLNSLS